MAEINELAAALVAAQADLKNPPMDSVNPHFRSKFASLKSCNDAVRGVLQKHGLAVVQRLGGGDGDVAVETLLVHTSGQVLSCGIGAVKPDKGGAQAAGSAITYLRRYGLLAALSLVGDPDDDAEAAEDHDKPQTGSTKNDIAARAKVLWGESWKARMVDEAVAMGLPENTDEWTASNLVTLLAHLRSL